MRKRLFESTNSQRMHWMLALVLIGLCAAAPMIWAQIVGTGAADDHTVLILEKSVRAPASTSLEAQKATALGFTVEIASDAQWGAKSTAQFATYRAIILGDPSAPESTDCAVDPAPIAAADSTKATWGPAITGNVVVVGTDPANSANHTGDTTGAGAQLTSNAIGFAALPHGHTGAYIALSCYYYLASSGRPVPVLDPFGSFTVEGQGNSPNSSHIVAPTHPVMTGLTDARLSNWSNSTHEAFDTWPASFRVLAIQEGITSSFVAPDGTIGAPYVIARGGETHTQTFSADGPFPESKTFSFGTGTTAHSIRFTLTQAPSDNLNFDVSVTAFLVAQNDPNFNSRLNPTELTRSRLNPQFVASLTPFVPTTSSGFVCDTYADPTNNNCTIYDVAVTAASGTTFGEVEKLVKWNGTLQDPKLFRAETSSSDFVELDSVVYQDPGVGSSSNGFSEYTVGNDTSTSGQQVQVLFSSPKPDNSSTFRKTRSTVPIRFTLAQGSTFLTGSSGFTPHIMVGLCPLTSACEGSTAPMPVTSAGSANTADMARFDPIKGNWLYNLDVTPSAYVFPRTYRVTVHVGGLSPDQSVLFKLTQ